MNKPAQLGAPVKGGLRRALALVILLALVCSLLGGCGRNVPAETTIFAMDTVMTLTAYGDGAEDTVTQASTLIYQLQNDLSVTDEKSQIYALNHQGSAMLSQDTVQLLEQSLQLCQQTKGALDITAYPAVHAWGFTTGEYRVPSSSELEYLTALIDYAKVSLDSESGQCSLPQGMELDFGAVAKGYTGDRLAQLAGELGVTCALFSLGGNIQAVGSRPDGSPWRVGIQDPAGDGYLGVVQVCDQAVITSGGYQRFFEQDGQTYWHILNPDTAAPARSGLASVTIVGPSGLTCDALSTALFVMGQEKALEFWRSHPQLQFEAVFIGEDGSIAITAGLEDSFTLNQGYQGREVTVLS